MRRAAAFCLFMGTSPINFGLLDGNGNTLKSKTKAKLIEKRTSIAAVRGKLGQIDTFLTHLFSHCRLPLRRGGSRRREEERETEREEEVNKRGKKSERGLG